MAGGNPLLDDMAKLMTGVVGVAQAAGEEARTVVKSQGERFVADMDLASRDEVDALKALARTALEQVEALTARVETLEKQLADMA